MSSNTDPRKGPYNYLFRVLIVGDSGVGKTNLLFRFTKNEFIPDLPSTVGIDFCFRNLSIDNKVVRACVWDTAGQDKFKSITSAYYRGSMITLLVYDITNRESFLSLTTWLQEIRKHTDENIVITLIGNKSDLSADRKVSLSEAVQFAERNNLSFIETSAVSGSKVDTAFLNSVTEAYNIFVKQHINKNSLSQEGNRSYIKNLKTIYIGEDEDAQNNFKNTDSTSSGLRRLKTKNGDEKNSSCCK